MVVTCWSCERYLWMYCHESKTTMQWCCNGAIMFTEMADTHGVWNSRFTRQFHFCSALWYIVHMYMHTVISSHAVSTAAYIIQRTLWIRIKNFFIGLKYLNKVLCVYTHVIYFKNLWKQWELPHSVFTTYVPHSVFTAYVHYNLWYNLPLCIFLKN